MATHPSQIVRNARFAVTQLPAHESGAQALGAVVQELAEAVEFLAEMVDRLQS